MNPAHHERLAGLFEQLVELDPAQRAARLAELDSEIRSTLEGLLVADSVGVDPLAAAITPLLTQEPTLAQGARLGDYRVLRELGAGGMGTVLLAERADGQYQQQVAIKLIRGFPTSDGQRRLRQERQILAQLDHPNIAHLLDGGETTDGQPFVVMELVDGLPLLDYAAENHLDLNTRLALFDCIAAAVQHAHQRLVIHRDIKPGNVLVRSDGQPKLLDFGVAKLSDVSATSDPRQTSTRVWTPGYASPEQQRGESITTATDVYALGVLLRELLCGERAPGQVGGLPNGFQRLTLDDDLRGALAMATAELPAQRYATVEAMRDDLARYRDGRPLRAHPDTRRYRLRKFLVRHRSAALLVLVALLFALGFVWRLEQERSRALSAEAVASEATQAARRDAETARAALAFLTDALAAAAPESALRTEISARDLLESARLKLDQRSTADAGLRQPVQRMLGHLYQALGEPQTAEALFAQGLLDVQARQRDDALALAADHDGHSSVLGALERGAESLQAAQRAQQLRERFAPEDPEQRLRSLDQLGYARYSLGEYDAADALWSEALAVAESLPDPPLDVVTNVHQVLGSMLAFRGDTARALQLVDKGLAFADANFPEDSPYRVSLLRLKGETLSQSGDPTGAEIAIREAIALQGRTVGPRGSRMATLHNALALVLNELGRYREAIDELQAAGELRQSATALPIDAAVTLANLGAVLESAGDYAAALQHFERAMALAGQGESDPEHLARRMMERAMARCMALAGLHAEALERLGDLQRSALRLDGEDSFEYAMTTWQLAVLARRRSAPEDGLKQTQLAEQLFTQLLPESHPVFAHMRRARADFARMQGDLVLAERLQREAIEHLQANTVLPVNLAIARAELAAILLAADRPDDARASLREALPILRASLLETEVSRAEAEVNARLLGLPGP